MDEMPLSVNRRILTLAHVAFMGANIIISFHADFDPYFHHIADTIHQQVFPRWKTCVPQTTYTSGRARSRSWRSRLSCRISLRTPPSPLNDRPHTMIRPRRSTIDTHTTRLGKSSRTPFLGKNARIQGLSRPQDGSVDVSGAGMSAGLCAAAVLLLLWAGDGEIG
jgi:hypothetical protein